MADANPMPTEGIRKVRITKTVYVCPDGHKHETAATAQKCLAGRPGRIRGERRRREREEYQAEMARKARAEAELRNQETAKFKVAWQASEIFASELERRVSMALFAQGVAGRAAFREKFVTEHNSLDIPKLGRVAMLHIDDYPAILRWLNAG